MNDCVKFRLFEIAPFVIRFENGGWRNNMAVSIYFVPLPKTPFRLEGYGAGFWGEMGVGSDPPSECV